MGQLFDRTLNNNNNDNNKKRCLNSNDESKQNICNSLSYYNSIIKTSYGLLLSFPFSLNIHSFASLLLHSFHRYFSSLLTRTHQWKLPKGQPKWQILKQISNTLQENEYGTHVRTLQYPSCTFQIALQMRQTECFSVFKWKKDNPL